MRTGGYYSQWEVRRNAWFCFILFFSPLSLWEKNWIVIWLMTKKYVWTVFVAYKLANVICDRVNKRDSLCLCLSTTWVHSHLLGMNWTNKALLLISKWCREYPWGPDQHTLFRIRIQILKMKALCPRLGPGKSYMGLSNHRLRCLSKVTPYSRNPRL